jgi:hypothetical protein
MPTDRVPTAVISVDSRIAATMMAMPIYTGIEVTERSGTASAQETSRARSYVGN